MLTSKIFINKKDRGIISESFAFQSIPQRLKLESDWQHWIFWWHYQFVYYPSWKYEIGSKVHNLSGGTKLTS